MKHKPYIVYGATVLLWMIPTLIRLIGDPQPNIAQIILFCIGLLVAIVAYHGILKPWIKAASNRNLILDSLIGSFAEGLKIPIRANVMIARYPLFSKKPNELEIVYRYNMNSDPDVDLRLSITQGIAGQAFNESTLMSDTIDYSAGGSYYGMTPEQRAKTNHVKAVVSVPIWDIRADRGDRKKIGVLNLDSKDVQAASLLLTVEVFEWAKKSADFISLLDVA